MRHKNMLPQIVFMSHISLLFKCSKCLGRRHMGVCCRKLFFTDIYPPSFYTVSAKVGVASGIFYDIII